MHINTGRTSQGVGEVRTGRIWHQCSGVNGREGIVSIGRSEKSIMRWTQCQGEIGWNIYVDFVKGNGAYWRRHIEEGTEITPPT